MKRTAVAGMPERSPETGTEDAELGGVLWPEEDLDDVGPGRPDLLINDLGEPVRLRHHADGNETPPHYFVVVLDASTSGKVRGSDEPGPAHPLLVRLLGLSRRLHVRPTALLEALEQLAASTGQDSEEPARSLTAAEEEGLREAGSLQYEMPAIADRGSTRSQLRLTQLVEGCLTVKEAGALLNVSVGRVRQRLGARTLLGIERPGGWLLPAFQFPDDTELPGLSAILPSFPADAHPAAVYAFFTRPSSELNVLGEDVSPQEWLTSGGSADAVEALIEEAYALP